MDPQTLMPRNNMTAKVEFSTLNSNIVLIGFMGSGKTTIGKRLAKHLKHEYLDTDCCIIEEINMPLNEFIEQHGEQAFRLFESKVLENLLGRKKLVLATGGGIILSSKNQKILRQFGTIVWLHASADKLFERVRRHASRPLLEVENPRRTFNHLLSERLIIYEALSQIKIDTTHLSYQQTIDAIIQKL